jgi:chromosome segregation ATPase
MSETTDKVYQDRIVALETEVNKLREELSNASVQATKASIANLEADVKAKATEIEQLNTQLAASKEAVETVTKRAETAEANEAALKAELAKVEASQKRSERLATLISKGASQEQSETLVAKLENLTDEQFASTVDVLSAAFKPFKKDGEEDKDEDKDKKDKGKASDATQVIDNATVVEEPALAAASETPSTEGTRIAVAKFLQTHLRYNSKVKID